MKHSQFLNEILEQPSALQRTVSRFDENAIDQSIIEQIQTQHFKQIVLVGMGSSYYGCRALYLQLAQGSSIPVSMWEASELVHFATTILTNNTMLIVVSQSGESAEIVQLIEVAPRPALVISVTNHTDNTLARFADIALLTHAGPEATVSTKTYTTTLALLHLLGVQLTGGSLEAEKVALLQLANDLQMYLSDWSTQIEHMRGFFSQCETLAFIGRGPSLASVNTGTLITQESSKLFCTGLSSGQFRHGPLELVRAGFFSVMFLGTGKTRALNELMALDIANKGGKCMVVGAEASQQHANILNMSMRPQAGSILPILEIVPIQLLTIPLAEMRGFEPAVFEHATKITRTE